MSLFSFLSKTSALKDMDREMVSVLEEMRQLFKIYHLKLILVQQLRAAEGSEKAERHAKEVLHHLEQYLKQDQKLELEKERRLQVIVKLLGKTKPGSQEEGIREEIGFLKEDLAKVKGQIENQVEFLKRNSGRLAKSSEALDIFSEMVQREAEILFGLQQPSGSERVLLNDLKRRVDDLLEERGVKKGGADRKEAH